VSPDDFFQHRREWSRWKHGVLKRYLGKFAGILGSRHPTLYYIDGFAGAGQYNDPPEPGSPVIAAKLAAEAPANRRPYTLRCINIEPDTFDELVSATADIAPGLVENRKGTFREHLPDILSTIGPSPALFFLDPYGHKGMEWDVVSQLAQRSQAGRTTEVLLNFFISKIDKDGGWIDSVHKAGPAFVRHLDELFGTTDWQALYTANKDQATRMHALTMLYRQRVAAGFDGIASSYGVRTIQGALKYHVIHGTHAPIGRRVMSDVVYRVSEEYRHEQASHEAAATNQLPLFPRQEPTDEERDTAIATALAPDIHALRATRACFTFTEIQDALMTTWFGRALEKHYRAACKRLIASGNAEIVRTSTTSPRSRGGINDKTIIQLR
jgi:three-Cys-motif partner protein